MNNNPELMRLTLDDENRDMIEELNARDWIPRWLNRSNKKYFIVWSYEKC